MAGKKKAAVQGPVVPTSANADRLLRELMRSHPDWENDEIRDLIARRDERMAALLQDRDLVELERRLHEARDRWKKYRESISSRIKAVRQHYLAEGVTDRVARGLQALVEELNVAIF